MAKNYYKSGEFNLICDVCGKKIKAGQAKHRWDGFVVCPVDFEMRHPQDFVKAKTDKITIPFSRPRPPDYFTVPFGIYEMFSFSESVSFQMMYDRTLSDTTLISDTSSSQLTKQLYLLDTLDITDDGTISLPIYAIDYFAEDYTATSESFT